jgi:hypothetical protein
MNITTDKNYDSDPSLYSVTSFKEWQTYDGGGFQGRISHKTDGYVVDFHNDGNGGPDDFRPARPGRDGIEAFMAWARAHPALPAIWEEYGFVPKFEIEASALSVMITEYQIAKEVKKGYLVYQMPDAITDYCGAKIGRKKAKADEPTLAWLAKEVPTAICRNVDGPAWSDFAKA